MTVRVYIFLQLSDRHTYCGFVLNLTVTFLLIYCVSIRLLQPAAFLSFIVFSLTGSSTFCTLTKFSLQDALRPTADLVSSLSKKTTFGT